MIYVSKRHARASVRQTVAHMDNTLIGIAKISFTIFLGALLIDTARVMGAL